MDICVAISEGWVDEDGGKEDKLKAQVSTTCVPYVLMIFIVWPARRGVAMPWRAGMAVSWEDILRA
jgi:hypothetical protein